MANADLHTQDFVEKASFLVIEDAAELISVWKILFRRAGYDAQFCTSGSEALALIDSGYRPRFIMTDYYLPDTNGLALIETMQLRLPELRCLLVTGNKDDTLLAQVRKKKRVSLIYKPVKFDQLEKEIVKLQAT